MELLKGPAPVTESYRAHVAQTLITGRVTSLGLFDQVGTFDIVRLGQKRETGNTTRMWALNLLRFTEAQDGVRVDNSSGFLHVFHGRLNPDRGQNLTTVHVMTPDNVRIVDDFHSFETKVGQSGWLFNERAAWRQREVESNPLTNQRLEEILANAEVGIRPPFFDDHTRYIKVEPALEGRKVYVVRFDYEDAVVIDIEDKQLVGRKVERLLSQEKWTVKA